MKRDVPPLHVVELRLMISVVVLGIVLAIVRPRLLAIGRQDVVPLLVLGLVGIAAIQGTYYTNVGLVGVGLAILLQYLAPALIVAYEGMTGRSPVTRDRVIALFLATAGTALLVLADGGAVLRAQPLGIALGLASAVFFAFYIVFGKSVLARLHPWTVLFYSFLAAGLFWMIFVPPWAIAKAGYGRWEWTFFVYIAFASALVPFALFYTGLERLAAARAGIVALLEPIVAVVSSAWWLREGLTLSQSVGALLVLVGIGWAQWKDRAPEPSEHAG